MSEQIEVGAEVTFSWRARFWLAVCRMAQRCRLRGVAIWAFDRALGATWVTVEGNRSALTVRVD